MLRKINSALISVFYKDGLDAIAKILHSNSVTIYSTGGTQAYIEQLGIPCVAVESVSNFPEILGGRVKTLHPAVFGGILGRRHEQQDLDEMQKHNIPPIDLVIVDLYPFEETVKATTDEDKIIEKIDIGGPSMIRAAAKNHRDVVVIASKQDYKQLGSILTQQQGNTTIEQRRMFAAKAFDVVREYDEAISNYFAGATESVLRYGENPHQSAVFNGRLSELLTQLHGKDLSHNNLVDIDAALGLMADIEQLKNIESVFAIIKHTNVCGIASRPTLDEAWKAALAGDPESAFGGILVTNKVIDGFTAQLINSIFFEVLIAPGYTEEATGYLKSKKNRIIVQAKSFNTGIKRISKTILNGQLTQDKDAGNFKTWKEDGGRKTTKAEQADLSFANIICKHLKSNAIVIVKNMQLVGKGCGQTSRIDALRHAIQKAKQFSFDLKGSVLASDAFFPFDDCVKIAHAEGVAAFIQPGGSVRDEDSIKYCRDKKLAMILTGMRHFRH